MLYFSTILTQILFSLITDARFIFRDEKPTDIIYANGVSETDLPICVLDAVCNKIDNFTGTTRVHRLCRCAHPHSKIKQFAKCSTSFDDSDERTINDNGQKYKMCHSTSALPVCQFFRDTTYTITTYPAQNRTQQIMRCICPPESSTYISKWNQKHKAPNHKIIYHYACSPQTFLKCGNEEPCSLLISSGLNVHKQSVCSCPPNMECPSKLTDSFIKVLTFDQNQNATTYGAFCRKIG